MSFFYLSLYFKASGVTDAQLGFLVTAGSGASILFSILAAPLVDRMGRRLSTFVFDLIGSAFPFLLYAVGGSFGFALAGTLLANASRVMNVGYYLLMAEDSPNEERTAAFNVFNIIYVASGLLLPLAGGFVAQAGILKAERIFLLLSAGAIAVSAFGRYFLSSETAAGAAIIERARKIGDTSHLGSHQSHARNASTRHAAFKLLLVSYKQVFPFLSSDRRAAAAAAANTLFYVYYIVGTNSSLYFTLFFANALGMGASMAGTIGAIWAGGTLLAMLFLNPPVFRRFGPIRCALFGALLNAMGFVPLLFIARGSVLAVMAALGVAALGFGMLKSAIDAVLAVSFGEGALGTTITAGAAARSGVYAAVNLGSSILGMGAGALCGLFYGRAPRFIPAFSLLLLTAIGVALGTAYRATDRAALRHPQSGRSRRRS
ncbi:MAG: MFS transporter [Rectinemataceae bacterium]